MRSTASMMMSAIILLAVGCVAGPAPAPSESVTGTALYRERIALPPGAVLEVTLEDVSRMDVAADPIATVTQADIGQPPYAFSLGYDPRRIIPSRDYAVRGRITLAGRLLFTTDTRYAVITNGNPRSVELVLKRVAGAAGRDAGGKPGDLYATLPATFTGVLPCADCGGIDYHIDFFRDGSYYLRTEYLGRAGSAFDDIGSYALGTDGITLALQGGREAPLFFSIEDSDTLRKLDIGGRAIESELGYDLKRADAFAPVEPQLAMRGMFSYMADAPGFTECLTGQRMPVAMEEGYQALERAYLDARGEPGAPIMASLEGRIARRMPMEGPGPVPTLVVSRFIKLWPGEACPPRFANAPLEDTYWRLTSLSGSDVFPSQDQPEPHFILRSKEARLSGSDGCNRMVGGYATDGDGISFSQMASTMMACPADGEVSQRFAEALATAKRWRIVGHHLELYDSTGEVLARLEGRDPSTGGPR